MRTGAKLSVLEDLALFPEAQPVENMKLYQVSYRFWGFWWGDIRVQSQFVTLKSEMQHIPFSHSLSVELAPGWLPC